jgi:hypothetical protein
LKLISEENYLQGREIGPFPIIMANVIMLKRAENIQEKLAHNLLEFIET